MHADEPVADRAKERERQVVEWCAGYWESYAYHSQDTHKDDLCFLVAMHTDVSTSARLAIRAALSAVAVPNDTRALLRIAADNLPEEVRLSVETIQLTRLKALSGPLIESTLQVDLIRTGLVA